MSLFTKLVKKSLKDFVRRRKKWFIAMGIFLVVFVGINYVIDHYVGKVVGNLIKEFVEEKSDGFYYVDFEEISYILNSGTFYMSEFTFDIHPKHKEGLDLGKLTQNYTYTSHIPSLHIDIIDFWSIFIHKKLRVIGIKITSPTVRITNLNKNKAPKKISFEAGQLYNVLSGHLNELKINDFKIIDGEFDYDTYQGAEYDNFEIKGLNFEVNNFRVNEQSIDRKDKIFYTDDISLEIHNQVLYLKDSLHKVTFDKFYISTSENEFGFENFLLTRRENPHVSLQDHDHYEISLPNLRLAGIDFINAYNNNLLVIDSIKIIDPEINITKRTQSQRRDSTRNSLLDVAMIYHDYLMIDHFDLVDANVIFTDERKDIPKEYSIDHISAHITKVEIDTVSYSKNQYGFHFDEADLMVKDYEVSLPDSLNTIKFAEFSISSNPFEITLKDLSINPVPKSSSQSKKNMLYASIPYLVIKNFDLANAINSDTFLIDEIYLEEPEINIVQLINNDKVDGATNSMGGLFGLSKIIQDNTKRFELDLMNVVDAKFEFSNLTKGALTIRSEKVDIVLEDYKVDSLTNIESDMLGSTNLMVSLENSSINIPEADINVQKILYESPKTRLAINNLDFSTSIDDSMNGAKLSAPELVLTGINPNEVLFNNLISLDTVKFSNLDISVDLDLFANKPGTQREEKESNFPPLKVNHLIGIDYDIAIQKNGDSLFTADNANYKILGLTIDQSLSDNPLNQFDYRQIDLISVDNYDLYLTNQQHIFRSGRIYWNNRNSTFSMENVSLKPQANTNNQYDIEIPSITMSGINLKKVLKESYYEGDEIVIQEPQINLKLAKGRQEKMTSLDLGFIPILLRNTYHGAKSDAFKLVDGRVNVQQQVEDDTLILEADRINIAIDQFEVNSTTEMVPDRFLFANDVRMSGEYITAYHQNKGDFFNINHYDISTRQGDVKLQGIYYASDTKDEISEQDKTKLSVDNLNLLGISFFDLTQNKSIKLNDIKIDNADVQIAKKGVALSEMGKEDSLKTELDKYHLINPKKEEARSELDILEDIAKKLEKQLQETEKPKLESKKNFDINKQEYLFDTMLIKSIEIDEILITDSKLDYKTNSSARSGLLLPHIWFLAEGIRYDPTSAKDSSRILYTDNLMTRITNFSYVLPDNLSSIRVEELTVNSKDSTIKAQNFALVPLVGRYDFGIAKGFQSTWLQIENDSILVNKVDFLGLINQRKFSAQSLDVSNVNISVFRDKRNPFPEWQRRPLPQTNLRGLNFTFGIDTVNVTGGFITYQEHSEKAFTTGEVFFSDLNAKVLNVTNDSLKTAIDSQTRIGVSAKIFGKGLINGDFVFDLVNTENIHSYGIDVSPFDLTEFNRIMIPSASVQISSGQSNRIIMSAKANEDYSYGDMKFYYEDLKIQLLNRETETPKGLGNALGSFFANTFIIKSNNPRNLILRKGDIFFERDKKRAIFNYWTKTFLSGVISSIGAANNKKKIKKMQDEKLKEIQNEKNYITQN